MNAHTIDELRQLQAMPLSIKIKLTQNRIREWIREYGEDGVYVSFSGGKDSTVLLDIVRSEFPRVKGCFVNTGLEYPEIVKFVKTFDNIDIIRPEMNFKQVIEKYGYPFISKEVSQTVMGAKRALRNGNECSYRMRKLNGEVTLKDGTPSRYNIPKYKFLLDAPFEVSHFCCKVMKKEPSIRYEKETGRKAILGQTAEESQLREQVWIKYGCNGFDMKRPKSNPLSFWKEQDILRYLKDNNIPIASVYGDIVIDYEAEAQLSGQIALSDLGLLPDTRPLKTSGLSRTGCIFCGYGCQMEKPGEGRFERLKVTHPKIYDYIMRPKEQGGLGYKEIIDYINSQGGFNIKY